MKKYINKILIAIVLSLGFTNSLYAKTEVVLLGTGTPVPDYKRAGAGTAVIYNGKAYLFDAGHGVVQKLIEASKKLGIKALYPTNINHFFLTHHHTDHFLDYPELAATYWWRRTSGQLQAWGPKGMKTMNEGYEKFMEEDIVNRLAGSQPIKNPTFWQVNVHEYEKGIDLIVKDGDVTIEAFDVPHGELKYAFGYKITTPDKTIIISGDTAYSEDLVKIAKDADIIVHEVACEAGLRKIPPFWQKYHHDHHTTTSEIADIANQIKPDIFVLTHVLHYKAPREQTLKEVQDLYKGKVVLGNDLDVF